MILKLIGFFFAGMAVNLTPCVYPMVTVTTSLFKPRQGQTLKHSLIKALCYVLGIAITYSVLGYLAASTGKLFGSVLQSSWVQAAIALVMFALGFSMLGFFQISAPTQWLNKLHGLRGASYLGLFFSGMFVGVFAAPCIGPPVLALLANVADHGDPQYGLLVFFIFSLGLGLPYLLLGTCSGMAARLPKAGHWLIGIERIFGIILVGFGLFYLFIALHLHVLSKDNEMIFSPYTESQLQIASQNHEPVVLDFYAQWCLGCHELDKNVFSDKKIKGQLKKIKAFRVDATNMDDPKVAELIDRYGIVGLPTVVFIDRQGHELKELRAEGSLSLKEFSKSLKSWAYNVGIDL